MILSIEESSLVLRLELGRSPLANLRLIPDKIHTLLRNNSLCPLQELGHPLLQERRQLRRE